MDKLYLMTVFVAVAEEESFAGGARRLQISPPAVTRAVAALEEVLKVRLLNRTTRHVRVTDAGMRYLEDARRIIGDVEEANETAAGVNAEPRGHLAVTAPVIFGRIFVLPCVIEYLQRYSEMEVSALFLDRAVNLLEEGIDVGVRIGELPDSSMKATRVGVVRQVICASPKYLKTHGTPSHPDDLTRYDVISAISVSPSIEWKFKEGSRGVTVRVKPRLKVSSNDAAIEAAVHDFGLTRLMSYQVASYISSGKLKVILSEFEPEPMPIHVLHREGRYASAKVRSFVDLIVASLRANTVINTLNSN